MRIARWNCVSSEVIEITVAECEQPSLTLRVEGVPNGDGGVWWVVTEESRVALARWLGFRSTSPTSADLFVGGAAMTIGDILRHDPCESGREQWLAMYGDLPLETEVSLGDVARACGAQAAWWCLCACDASVRRRAIEVVLRCAVDRAAAAAAAAPGETGELWAAEAAEAAAEWLAYRTAEAAAWSAAWSSSSAAWSAAYDRELEQQAADLIEAFPCLLEVRHD